MAGAACDGRRRPAQLALSALVQEERWAARHTFPHVGRCRQAAAHPLTQAAAPGRQRQGHVVRAKRVPSGSRVRGAARCVRWSGCRVVRWQVRTPIEFARVTWYHGAGFRRSALMTFARRVSLSAVGAVSCTVSDRTGLYLYLCNREAARRSARSPDSCIHYTVARSAALQQAWSRFRSAFGRAGTGEVRGREVVHTANWSSHIRHQQRPG